MSEMWKPQSISVLRQWLRDIETEASDKLNDWENSFISQITLRLDQGYQLTKAQEDKLEQIYVKHTS